MIRLLDLFSGIGGFSLAAQWVWGDELEIVAFCEIDKFAQKVLKKHWPDVPIVEDVKDVKTDLIAYHEKQIDGWHIGEKSKRQIQELRKCSLTRIDLLTGGFPCQPFSVAGKRKGKEDNRFLWPEMFRVIQEIRPRWVVAENVAGIVRMELDNCLSDLEGEGYSTQAIIIPACAVNAPHRRNRVWIVAYANGNGTGERHRGNPFGKNNREISKWEDCQNTQNKSTYSNEVSQDVADFHNKGLSTQWNQEGIREAEREACPGVKRTSLLGREWNPDWWLSEPDVGRVAHGVPSRVDRLKSLGNAIVPRVAYEIFMAIKGIEELK